MKAVKVARDAQLQNTTTREVDRVYFRWWVMKTDKKLKAGHLIKIQFRARRNGAFQFDLYTWGFNAKQEADPCSASAWHAAVMGSGYPDFGSCIDQNSEHLTLVHVFMDR